MNITTTSTDIAPRAGARSASSSVLTAAYTVCEIVGGWLTGSLALLADAGHMLGGLGGARRWPWSPHGSPLGRRPPSGASATGARRSWRRSPTASRWR